MRQYIVCKENLPYNIMKPLGDLLEVFDLAVIKRQEINEIVYGELYLTARSSDKARSICCAEFVEAQGRSYLAEFQLEAEENRGEWVRCAKLAVLSVMEQAGLKTELPWGILTGVRPGKLAHKLLASGQDLEKVLIDKYMLPVNKTALLKEIVTRQSKLIPLRKNDIAIYIGVPYCPSRCLYCSFPAGIIPGNDEFQQNFCNLIEEDIRAVVQLTSMYDLNIKSLYVGGGTPTSLSEKFFRKLMESISKNFSIEKISEFTVEAGRPDCLSEDKLRAMEEAGVNRISLNPQTMHDSTLRLIGRQHTVQQVYEAYDMIRKGNIPVVNMDLIVGLPQESPADIKYSLNKMLDFCPENLTIHTLTLKKGAPLFKERDKFKFLSAEEATEVLDYAGIIANKLGMRPYYLYRQHYMLGNLANIGYALPGTESIYNIQMMEERHAVIGIGPSSATKVPAADGHHLYKFHMPKDFSAYQINSKQLFKKRAGTIALRYEQEE